MIQPEPDIFLPLYTHTHSVCVGKRETALVDFILKWSIKEKKGKKNDEINGGEDPEKNGRSQEP